MEYSRPRINLVKLCVGTNTVEDLLRWQEGTAAKEPDSHPRHVTRMWPRRRIELLNGGSLYWVLNGFILCRQTVVALEEVIGSDDIIRCGIVLDPAIVRTRPIPRRPFQGWRYLRPEDAPVDLSEIRKADRALPVALDRALAEIGVL